MKKFLVVTSITHGKDKLLDPPIKFDNCDYFAFVDKKNPDAKIWEQKDIHMFSSIDGYYNRRNAKPYKILSTILFPEYEYIIWCDGNHQLKVNPQTIIDEYGDGQIYVFKHPDRNCLFDELSACIKWKMDVLSNLDAQEKYYRSIGFPKNFGLYELPTFMVKNTEKIKKFQFMWFEQICKFSSRDQISFPFCIWNNELKNETIILNGFANVFSMIGRNSGNKYFEDQGRHLKY
jgi:hypothetical protein